MRTARANVNVMVQDENDNPPLCGNGNITMYALVGILDLNDYLEIATISCTDLDLGRNAEILLHITNTPMLSDGRLRQLVYCSSQTSCPRTALIPL